MITTLFSGHVGTNKEIVAVSIIPLSSIRSDSIFRAFIYIFSRETIFKSNDSFVTAMELSTASSSSPDLYFSAPDARGIGTPRFEAQSLVDSGIGQPFSDTMHFFYESTLLLSVLGPVSEDSQDDRQDSTSSKVSSRWHRFLDDLAWLGDTQLGGKSVTSIGVESVRTATRFWVASNGEVTDTTLNHLRWVLDRLRTVGYVAQHDLQQLIHPIFVRSVNLSQKKVQNYARRLSKFLNRAQTAGADHLPILGKFKVKKVKSYPCLSALTSPPDQGLLSALEQLIAVRDDPLRLCVDAYQIRQTRTMLELNERCQRGERLSDWASIRHYVGRLGSWVRAARTVVHMAWRAPDFFRQYQIERIPNPRPSTVWWTTQPPVLEDVLQNLFPAFDWIHFDANLDSVAESYRKVVAKTIRQKGGHSRLQPKVHAEILVAEHFYRRNLNFQNHDRYIGCSKPSCYCCDLYLKYHPGRFVRRPTHGNIWVKWQPPYPAKTRAKDGAIFRQQILAEMIKDIGDSIRKRMMLTHQAARRAPDSATGFSGSIAYSHQED